MHECFTENRMIIRYCRILTGGTAANTGRLRTQHEKEAAFCSVTRRGAAICLQRECANPDYSRRQEISGIESWKINWLAAK
jgi:chitinase